MGFDHDLFLLLFLKQNDFSCSLRSNRKAREVFRAACLYSFPPHCSPKVIFFNGLLAEVCFSPPPYLIFTRTFLFLCCRQSRIPYFGFQNGVWFALFVLATWCSMWDLSSQPGIEPSALQWELRDLTTGPVRKYLSGSFNFLV